VDLLVAQIHRNERGLPQSPSTVQVPGSWRSGPSVKALGTAATFSGSNL
jgi:hypothetical protein